MHAMKERERNLVVRVDDQELAMLHAVANDRDEPIARVVRKFIRDAYGAKFGDAVPAPATLKHAPKR